MKKSLVILSVDWVLVALVTMTAIALEAAPCMANLVKNGNFANGTNPGSSYITVYPGMTTITDWTVVSGNVDYCGWGADADARSIDMSGYYADGTLKQNITGLTIGQEYMLTFAMGGNLSGYPIVKTLEVDIAGVSKTFTFDITGKTWTNMWTDESFAFTAIGTTADLLFVSHSYGGYGAMLDDVRLDPVPIPPSLLLLGCGLMGCGLLGWRQRQQE
jgi:choice-of-anchor C domain-containing protein